MTCYKATMTYNHEFRLCTQLQKWENFPGLGKHCDHRTTESYKWAGTSGSL